MHLERFAYLLNHTAPSYPPILKFSFGRKHKERLSNLFDWVAFKIIAYYYFLRLVKPVATTNPIANIPIQTANKFQFVLLNLPFISGLS